MANEARGSSRTPRTRRRPLADCLRCASRFAHGTRGVAAVEFALLLPLMLLMYVGTVDLTRGVLANRNLDLVSRTMSDLVAQQSTTSLLSPATMATFFNASSAIMGPFATANLKITVSAIDISADSNSKCCQALVRWSYSNGGTLRACKTALTLADPTTRAAPANMQKGIATANSNAAYGAAYTNAGASYVIVTDATYTYTPIFRQALSWFTVGMIKTTYMVPRSQNGHIQLDGSTSPPSGQTDQICISP